MHAVRRLGKEKACEINTKSKFKGHSHFLKPQDYSHRDLHLQNRGNGYLEFVILVTMAQMLIKKCQNVTKTIIAKKGSMHSYEIKPCA